MEESKQGLEEIEHDHDENTDISGGEPIPVCTLFNDPLNVNESPIQPSKLDPAETEEESELSSQKSRSESPDFKDVKTPVLCDVFAQDRADSSLEDIFSNLSNEQTTDAPLETIDVPVGMVKNDSFVIEDLVEEVDIPGVMRTEYEDSQYGSEIVSSQLTPDFPVISFDAEENESKVDTEEPIVGMQKLSLADPAVEVEMYKEQQGEELNNLTPLVSVNAPNSVSIVENASTGRNNGKNVEVELHSKKEFLEAPSSKSLFSSSTEGKDIFAEGGCYNFYSFLQ